MIIENKIITDDKLSLETAINICMEKHLNGIQSQNIDIKFVEIIKSHIEDFENHKYDFPLSLTWKIVSNCNLRCKHCYFYDCKEHFDSSNDLSLNKIFEIIDQLAEMNVIHVGLTGGEILLRKDFFEILNKLKSKNISVKLSTNATLITPKIAQKLKEFLNLNMDYIQVSLDGATAKTHEKTRGTGSFNKAIKGIKCLTDLGIYPTINYTITSYNVEEIPLIYKLTKKLGSNKVILNKFESCSENQDYLKPNLDLLFKSLAKTILYEKENQYPIIELRALTIYDFVNHKQAQKQLLKNSNKIVNNKEIVNRNFMCHHHEKFSIFPNGNVYLCFLAGDKNICPLGNLNEKSLIKIWENRENNELFKPKYSKNMACKSCNYLNLCRGGCPVKSYEKYKNINSPDKNCLYGQNLVNNS